MEIIKEAISKSFELNDSGQRKYTDVDICKNTGSGLPERVFYRWLAAHKELDGQLPDALPKKGKPSRLPFPYEWRLATWCNTEAMCQRSVAIPIINTQAQKVDTQTQTQTHTR